MTAAQSVEWKPAGETEVLRKNLAQRHFVHHMTRTWLNQGPQSWKSPINSLSYGTWEHPTIRPTSQPPSSWRWTLLQTPPVLQQLKDFLKLYSTRRFIPMFRRFPMASILSQWNRVRGNKTPLKSILILSSYLSLFLLVISFLLAFSLNSICVLFLVSVCLHALPIPIFSRLSYGIYVYITLLSYVLHTARHPNCAWCCNISGEEHMFWRSSICNVLQLPLIYSFLVPNILLSAFPLNTPSLLSP